jgi:hypothetical protein
MDHGYNSLMLGILTRWSHPEVVFLKIHILSDIHIEFGDFVPPIVGADVVVLNCGDASRPFHPINR